MVTFLVVASLNFFVFATAQANGAVRDAVVPSRSPFAFPGRLRLIRQGENQENGTGSAQRDTRWGAGKMK